MRRPNVVSSFLLGILSLTIHAKIFADGGFRTVVLSDQAATGTDAVFKAFNSAVLSDAGVVAFSAEVVGSTVSNRTRFGLWVAKEDGTTSLMFRGGAQAAGLDSESRYTKVIRVVINEDSQVAFSSGIGGSIGGVISRYGVWTGSTNENLELVAAFEREVPGTNPLLSPGGSFGSLALNNSQDLVFKSGLKSSPDSAIWFERFPQELQLIARSRTPAPDDPSGLLFSHFNDVIRLNDHGEFVFEDRLRDGSAVVPNTQAVYFFGKDSNLHRVIGTGDSLLLNSMPVTIELPTSPEINNCGHITFRTSYLEQTKHKEGIFMYADGAVSPVISEDDLTSFGLEERISHIGAYTLDGNGGVTFKAAVRESPDTPFEVSAIFRKEFQGPLESIARLGQQAPDLPVGTVFGYFNSTLPGGLGTNSVGQTIFGAHVRDSLSDQITGFGVWAQDRRGELKAVIYTGQIIDVDDGDGVDERVVSSYSWIGSGNNQDGLPSGFNDLGQVALRVLFTDGSSGILISNVTAVPEPSPLFVLIFCSLVFLIFKRSFFRARAFA